MEIHVETRSGYKADEYPKRFWIGDRVLEVMDIEDRWYGPAYSYYKVFADDGCRYMLKQHREHYGWEMARL